MDFCLCCGYDFFSHSSLTSACSNAMRCHRAMQFMSHVVAKPKMMIKKKKKNKNLNGNLSHCITERNCDIIKCIDEARCWCGDDNLLYWHDVLSDDQTDLNCAYLAALYRRHSSLVSQGYNSAAIPPRLATQISHTKHTTQTYIEK